MRIAWLTPLAPASAIGEFSCAVTAALAAEPGVDVELWTAEPGPLQAAAVPVRRLRGGAAEPADPDLLVHNIGNFPLWHAEIYDVSRRRPGIVILHDRVLHHMLAAVWQREPATFAETYETRMAAHHGDAARRVARDYLAGRRPPPWDRLEEVARFPLDVAALSGALGAVTHSRGHAERLRARWPGPVAALAMPTYRAVLERAAAVARPAREDGRLQLTTVGHVIPNKHVDRVIGMLAADDTLAARVQYTVLGELQQPLGGQLEELLHASPTVSAELTGWCPDERRDALMAATDVFVNLRHPVFESGSASLARELAYGRPILCFDGGSFGELPRDAVARVPAGDFDAAAAELARLVADPGRRRAIGERALALASARGEAGYARALLDFAGAAANAAPALALLDRAGAELAAMRAAPGLPVHDAVARHVRPLLGR